ncbi:MAG TPA: hypothetical protein VKX41_16810 [Alloacidobacterium sp.]|nr:hypothetical protein [Alloacidobacterium sp.]
MRILRQLGVLVLLAATFVSPAMACMTPSAPMTTEERACCRMMHNQCEQMGMSASHGCCQKAPRTSYAVPTTKADSLHSVAVAIPMSLLAASELLNPFSSLTGWVEHHDYSPPQSPPSTISVLRI